MERVNVGLRRIARLVMVLFVVLLGMAGVRAEHDPLPSWNKGAAKEAIFPFVKATTEKSSPQYVESKDRVATFDQDGTLWTEHPLYGQAMFALDRLGKLAPQHPEWKDTEPFKSVLSGDREAMSKFTEKDWMEIVAVTHTGMSTEDFQAIVKQWITTAKARALTGPAQISSTNPCWK